MEEIDTGTLIDNPYNLIEKLKMRLLAQVQ